MKPLENIQHYKIVLASNSPRRRELLSGLNLEYTVRVLPDIDESYPDTLKGEEIPMYISREKAEAYRNSMAEDELIITADTVVCINEKVLGKPRTQEEAKEMLRELSGKTHQVITGVCLMTCGLQRTFSATTQVTFDVLTEDEIEFYVEKFRPLDKAWGIRSTRMDWLCGSFPTGRLLFQCHGPSGATFVSGTQETLM